MSKNPDEEWEIIEKVSQAHLGSAMVAPQPENPITAVCIVSDKNRPPPGFHPITKAYDDQSQEADVWKDGFFAMSRVYRYICLCRTVPQNAFVVNVVADVAIVNEKDLVPPGFVPIEFTEDTSKHFHVQTHGTAVVQIDLDGLTICFKYSVIPGEFPGNSTVDHSQLQAQQSGQQSGMYPGLPYPVHPGTATSNGPGPSDHKLSLQTVPLVQRSDSAASPSARGIDGVPFELNPKLKAGSDESQAGLPSIREFTPLLMESEFSYSFRVEQQVLEQSLTATP